MVLVAFTLALVCFSLAGILFAVGGKNDNLANARIGDIFSFTYEQPVKGDGNFIGKVVSVRDMTWDEIDRLDYFSRYRRHDPKFMRTTTLVTCQSNDGKIRNFYAERTKNCKRSVTGGVLYRLGYPVLV